jgi:hypothetical protein
MKTQQIFKKGEDVVCPLSMVIHQSIGYRNTAFLQKWSFPNLLKEAKTIVQSSPKFDVM